MKAIINTKLVMEDGIIWDGALTFENGRIVQADWADKVEIPEGAEIIDAGGLYTAPGLIDIHNHGSEDHDFGVEPEAAIADYLKHGETTVLPTVYCDLTAQGYIEAGERIRAAARTPNGRAIHGMYMEGPYMSGYGSNQNSILWTGDIIKEDPAQSPGRCFGHNFDFPTHIVDLIATQTGNGESDFMPGSFRKDGGRQLQPLSTRCGNKGGDGNGGGGLLLAFHPAGDGLARIDPGRKHRFVTFVVEILAGKAGLEKQVRRNGQLAVDHHFQTACSCMGFPLNRADPVAGPVCQFQTVCGAGQLEIHPQLTGTGQHQPCGGCFSAQAVSGDC